MSNHDEIIEAMIRLGIESSSEKLQEMVEKFKRLTVTIFSLYLLKEAKTHEKCPPDNCHVIERIPEAMEDFIEEFSEDIRAHVELNLIVNGFSMGTSPNEKVREEILKEMEKDMITLPNTGGKQVHADSTGKQIFVGDKIKFRGTEYTLKGFGPNENHYNVATLIFEEDVHTEEVPHECNVDKVS